MKNAIYDTDTKTIPVQIITLLRSEGEKMRRKKTHKVILIRAAAQQYTAVIAQLFYSRQISEPNKMLVEQMNPENGQKWKMTCLDDAVVDVTQGYIPCVPSIHVIQD
jgi:hypothetical protein